MALIRRRWPRVRIVLRGDSGFTREPLMAWCEATTRFGSLMVCFGDDPRRLPLDLVRPADCDLPQLTIGKKHLFRWIHFRNGLNVKSHHTLRATWYKMIPPDAASTAGGSFGDAIR